MEILIRLLKTIWRWVENLMKLPVLQPGNTSRVMTDVFRGYNHNLKIADGEMFDMTKLTSDYFPMLARRKPRMFRPVTAGGSMVMTKPQGLLGGDQLVWMDNGHLIVDGTDTGVVLEWPNYPGVPTEPAMELVRMGHYVCVHPENNGTGAGLWSPGDWTSGYYYNLSNTSDKGTFDATYGLTPLDPDDPTNKINYVPCNIDGVPYTITYTGDTEPETPTGGEYWLTETNIELRQYDAVTTTWVKVETVYTLIVFPGYIALGDKFKEGDTVEISGLYYDELNGYKYLYKVGGDYSHGVQSHIVVIGLVPSGEQQFSSAYSVRRFAPFMQFVIECQNRLWGCAYYKSPQTGEIINEIYCSKLGDFKNWHSFQGLSTDSWTASVGAGGKFTGAINYMGKPVFFKEDRIFVVNVSPQGAHRIEEIQCRGIEKGSSRSAVVVGETLFYKSMSDVMAWQGGMPTSVSGSVFGDIRWKDAAAGAYGTKYYLAMRDAANDKHHALFVYDTARNFWMKDDEWTATAKTDPFAFFATVGEEIWGILIGYVGYDKKLMAMTGKTTGTGYQSEGIQGTGSTFMIPWEMETGIMYYEYPDHKYVSRFNVRLWMEAGTKADIYLEYDSSGTWVPMGEIRISGTGTVTVPIRPRRCDHMRMKLEGQGDFKILSIARILEVGSDV